MPPQKNESLARGFTWTIAIVVGLVILLVLALTFRSMWWKEEGAPIPRGTSLHLDRHAVS